MFDSLVHNTNSTWSLTDKGQTVRQFDSAGRLISITDKNGNTLINTYVGGVLRQIQDTAGRIVLLNTNGFGCISGITDPIGRIVGPEAMKFSGWQRLSAEYAAQFGVR